MMSFKRGSLKNYAEKDAMRELAKAQTKAEKEYAESLNIKKPEPPKVREPKCLERFWSCLLYYFTPPCFEDWTYRDCSNWSGVWVVIMISTFLVFFLPWMPMVAENHRTCESFLEDGGVFGDDSISSASVQQYIMNFNKDRAMRRNREYESILYSLDMKSAPLGRYFGDKNRLIFEDLDPLCDAVFDNNTIAEPRNGSVHYCIRPQGQRLLGAPKNKLGKQIILDIVSPQIPELLIEMRVNLRPGKKMFPNVEFLIVSAPNDSTVESGTRIRFISSLESRPYLRRTNFNRGELSVENSTSASQNQIIWLGAATPILSVGDYETRFKINDIPKNVSDDGKFHRICVPTDNSDLAVEEVPEESVEFIRAVLLSKDVSAKVGYHIRTSTLYRDVTSVNMLFKISMMILVVTIIVTGGLFALEHYS